MRSTSVATLLIHRHRRIQELEEQVWRLQDQLAGVEALLKQRMDQLAEAEAEVERLEEENERLRQERLNAIDIIAKTEVEVERLRAVRRRVETAMEVMKGTRFATPPMDASECVVLLSQALKESGK